jgi:hypothetical protein
MPLSPTRRRVLAACGALGTAGLVGTAVTQSTTDQWAQFCADAANTGFADVTLPEPPVASTRRPTDDPTGPTTLATAPTPDGGADPNTTPPDQGGDQGGLDDTATPTNTSAGSGRGFGVVGTLAALGPGDVGRRSRSS